MDDIEATGYAGDLDEPAGGPAAGQMIARGEGSPPPSEKTDGLRSS